MDDKFASLICEVGLGKDHRHLRSRMDAIVQNMFEINYSLLIQYEISEKLVTCMYAYAFLYSAPLKSDTIVTS